MAFTSDSMPPPNRITQRQSHFWYWHSLYWLGYLLVKYTHLAILVPLQNEAAWPYMAIYTLVTLINFSVTGYLGWHELHKSLPLLKQLKRLLLFLLPVWLLMTVLRQTLMLEYAITAEEQSSSWLRFFQAFSLVLLPLAGWLAVFLLIKANQLHYLGFIKQQALARQARQARLKVLRYQLNPHFMFNTLNALNALIVQRSGNKAEHLIEQLSVYLRHSLKNQQDSFIPLQQELEALAAYMAIQQIRFGERLHICWQLPANAPQVKIPPLLLQPLAETAIERSVADIAGPITLTISVRLDTTTLDITLAQQGADAHSGSPEPLPQTLSNLAERMQLLFGGQAHLTLNQAEQAFYSQIRIPLEALDGNT